MRVTERRRLLVVAVLIPLSLGAAGTAYGYWTAPGGSGSGAAGTGTTLAVTLSPGIPTAQLYPGGQAGVGLVVSNPNPFSARVESLTLSAVEGSGGFAVDAGHTACGVSSLSFTTQTNGGAGWTIPARVGVTDGSLPVTLPNALAMNTGAAHVCQDASFTVYLKSGS